jgi:hypothetical protein
MFRINELCELLWRLETAFFKRLCFQTILQVLSFVLVTGSIHLHCFYGHFSAPPNQTPATSIGSLLPKHVRLISEVLLWVKSLIWSFLSPTEKDKNFLNRLDHIFQNYFSLSIKFSFRVIYKFIGAVFVLILVIFRFKILKFDWNSAGSVSHRFPYINVCENLCLCLLRSGWRHVNSNQFIWCDENSECLVNLLFLFVSDKLVYSGLEIYLSNK